MTNAERIENELQILGITKRYRGYKQVRFAIELALENDDRLQNVTEKIYKVVAEQCSCGQSCIERNIRTVSNIAWRMNRPRLREISRYPLFAPPSASEFISIMSAHLHRSQEPPCV